MLDRVKELGFELLEDKSITEIQGKALVLRHLETGARVFCAVNNDDNKVFGISFRTPPKNATGVAHILEHSVLCGSKKYPLKEPFVELLKGSLQTFLNAMTFPDKTCYPVASQNKKDFYNLADVYWDAVFYPLITKEIFEQEGWHLDMASLDSKPEIKGVVYNEMKGNYSSPESLLSEYSQRAIFPDMAYGVDSGGDPAIIPELSYEEFKDFFASYYHPSNAWIYFYGNLDLIEELSFLSERLKEFSKREVNSKVPLQVLKKLDTKIEKFYPGDEKESKPMASVNWLLCPSSNIEENFDFRILDFILIGMPGSPLRQALIESGLGEDLVGSGLETSLQQLTYGIGLKGIAKSDIEKFKALVYAVLKENVKKGFSKELIEAAVNSIEFDLRENNTGSIPRGLICLFRALTTWLYDESPLSLLYYDDYFTRLKVRLKNGEKIFENLVEKYLISNEHVAMVVLSPDGKLGDLLEKQEQARIAKMTKGFSEKDFAKIVENTKKLQILQKTPDTPEQVATIPALKKSDLNRAVQTIPTTFDKWGETTVLLHDIDTAGILYVDVAFNLHGLKQEHLSYVPLFSRMLVESGAGDEAYGDFFSHISRKTGGIYASIMNNTNVEGNKKAICQLILRGKATADKMDDLLTLMQRCLLDARLGDKERFRQILLEEKASLEHSIVPAGNRFVALRLRASFSEEFAIDETLGGVTYLQFLRALSADFDNSWNKIHDILNEIKFKTIFSSNAVLNIVPHAYWKAKINRMKEFINALPQNKFQHVDWKFDFRAENIAFNVPSQVNYVGQVVDLSAVGYKYNASAEIACQYLRTDWLWNNVRVLGGAYGCTSQINTQSGLFTMVSYRDPNLAKTVEVFQATGKKLATDKLSEVELLKSMIGTVGKLDTPQMPEDKAYSVFVRYLIGLTDAKRQEWRDQILDASAKDLEDFGKMIELASKKALIGVVAGEAAIKGADKKIVKFDVEQKIL